VGGSIVLSVLGAFRLVNFPISTILGIFEYSTIDLCMLISGNTRRPQL
jgi:hypothetical protein